MTGKQRGISSEVGAAADGNVFIEEVITLIVSS